MDFPEEAGPGIVVHVKVEGILVQGTSFTVCCVRYEREPNVFIEKNQGGKHEDRTSIIASVINESTV